MSSLSFVTLDVFTTTRYAGNPLAVVHIPPDNTSVTTEQMQAIAREFNLSETVFIYERPADAKEATGIPSWRIRIFFPDHELSFAGHPVIGTAIHALSSLVNNASKGQLVCNAGPVDLDFDPEKRIARASIPHAFHRHTEVPFTPEQVYRLQPSLQSSGINLTQSEVDVLSPVKGMNFVSVQLPNLATLAILGVTGIKPQPVLDEAWRAGFAGSLYYVLLERGDGEGNKPTKLRTRMIEGSMEDPATGSASCGLSCFLALKMRLGRRTVLELTQGVEMGRQSDIRVEVVLDEKLETIEAVYLVGSAVPVMEGRVLL